MNKSAVVLLCGIAASTAIAAPVEISPEAKGLPAVKSLAERWAASRARPEMPLKIMPPWEVMAYSSGVEFPAGPVSACYAPGTPQSTIDAVEMAMGRYWGNRYNAGTSWTGNTNTVTTLRWSFAPDGISIPGGVGEATANNILFARMDALAARATWIAKFQQCFDRWGQITGITYVRVQFNGNPWDDGAAWGTAGADNLRGDCRISMHNIDGGNGILAYCNFPPGGDMVIDSSENWGGSSNDYRFLRNVVMHEHGHGIGLFHVCPANQTKLMEPFVSTAYDGPQQDDFRAGQYLYGDTYEPNGTSATATPAGALFVGGTLFPSNAPGTIVANTAATSLAHGFDFDYFSFTTAVNLLATVTITPLGTNYDSSVQNNDGSCASGSFINAVSLTNLTGTVFASNGTTQLAIANTGALGAPETISNVLLSPPGTFYTKVSASSVTSGQSQLYRVTINGTSAVTLSASDLTFPDKVLLNWTAIPNVSGYRILRGTTTNLAGAVQIGTTGFSGPLANTFNDTTATPGVQYYYWVDAGFLISGTTYRYQPVGSAEPGSRFGNPCTADFNGDGSLDFFDYLDFVDAYAANDPSADFNGDSTIDFFDYLDFVDAYSNGC